MHVVFIEPAFPSNQTEFVRGLSEIGVEITGIGERPLEALPRDTRERMVHYERISSVVDEPALIRTVQWIQERRPVDRLEATVEAHIMAAAHAREVCGIPGISSRTAFLCRDKPAMKEVLREAGVPTAQSVGATSADQARDFAASAGYPLIFKPRAGAGASDTHKVTNGQELESAIAGSGLEHGASVAIEEFVEGHEGFYDTITIGGEVVHEFITHYYPNVLEAMRTRWISPQFVTTNRIDEAPAYSQVKELGGKVIQALEIETAPTHMEWFFGPKGLRFSEIGCRPPGVGAWDLYCAANEFDLYAEWALAVCFGRKGKDPSRRYAAGIVALRPDRDGRIVGYEGVDHVHRNFEEWLIDYHLPPPGTPTQPVEAGYMANAWIRLKHPDYDELKRMLDSIGENVQVLAE